MKRNLLLAAALAAVAECFAEPPLVVVPPLPKVEIADVRAPAAPSVVVRKGQSLASIAAAAYGNENFSGFVGRLNHLADPTRLKAGTILKIPSLPIAFRDAGLDPHYQPAINALVKSWDEWGALLGDYLRARAPAGPEDKTIQIPPDLRARMLHCADIIDAAVDVLKHPLPGHAVPGRTIDQFSGASAGLRSLAAGAIGSYDYDTAEQTYTFVFGLTNAFVWTQEHYK